MITRQQKQQIIKELSDKFSQAKAVIFTDYSGLAVKDLTELRTQGKKAKVEFKVAKKNLIDLALQKIGLKDIQTKDMSGQIGLAFGYKDIITPAKILYNFSKTNQNLKILAGVLENKKAPLEEILTLAKLPSLEELQAQFVCVLAGPIRGLTGVLQGNLRKLVDILKNIKHKT